ncbi:MAG: FAD-dependent 5-carboxymethylaminomethyl-2-thiouridine(34) oxidoreductase MnmC [Burkholderiales bacterium]|jgi:tRNA 5-methylaminomethyl-2-thiouridine biosynthesis bifunctional protein|nr:FAD-dependent 5-carboxymethylaminomethyl-2-thiouridine(34) oxidoreductase MnmC [Burkholderiales bacterium]
MAGVWVSFQLALEGFEVVLLDTAQHICEGASGNAAGAFHPHLSIDDARMSKITRAGVSATLESLCLLTQANLLVENVDWGRTGHVQLFDDAQDEARFVKALQTLQFPSEWVRLLDQRQASERLGFQTRMGGLYFSQAGWLKPVQWCEAALAYIRLKSQCDGESGIGSIAFMPGCEVLSLRRLEAENDSPAQPGIELQLTDSTLAVDHVVIAAAQNSLNVFHQSGVVVNTVKGQVSVVGTEKPLKAVLSGASYAISFNEKELLIGATFERPCKSLEVTVEAHQENYKKLQRVFPENTFAFPTRGRSALRCAWLDRMPAIGCAINEAGEAHPQILYATGFGSRGMTWAVLAGKLLAARLSGRPSPLTQDLAAAVLPGRFFSRASNSKPTPPSGLSTK